MAELDIVERDGGWAYRIGNVLSERYPTHEAAVAAAREAAPGDADDGSGVRAEVVSDLDRPSKDIEDLDMRRAGG